MQIITAACIYFTTSWLKCWFYLCNKKSKDRFKHCKSSQRHVFFISRQADWNADFYLCNKKSKDHFKHCKLSQRNVFFYFTTVRPVVTLILPCMFDAGARLLDMSKQQNYWNGPQSMVILACSVELVPFKFKTKS